MNLTDQQAAVIAAARGTTSLLVNAVAGASKTTTSLLAAGVAGDNVGFVAFNKVIAQELSSRLGPNAEASTLHSAGFRLLVQAGPARLDERKVLRLLERDYPGLFVDGRGRWEGRKFLAEDFRCVPEIVSVCKSALLWPEESRADVIAACDARGVDLPGPGAIDHVFAATEGVLWACIDDPAVDFDDMVWLPLARGLARPQYHTLFVDEAQDLNPAQQELVFHLGERWAIVGDPRQAIYAFAGADELAFGRIGRRLAAHPRRLTELPLTRSFRVPASHAALAAILVPHFEARPDAPLGLVGEPGAEEAARMLRPGDMVICRSNAPVVALAYRLIAAGKPVMVRGRAIGDGLLALIRRFRPGDVTDLLRKLDQWERQQLERLEDRQASPAVLQRVTDQVACLRCLADGADTVGEVESQIASLFSDNDPGQRIVLSSIHRAKGLEADRVFVWEPGLLSGRGQDPNLCYVAITRSKSELHLVDDTVRRKDSTEVWLRRVANGATRAELAEKEPVCHA